MPDYFRKQGHKTSGGSFPRTGDLLERALNTHVQKAAPGPCNLEAGRAECRSLNIEQKGAVYAQLGDWGIQRTFLDGYQGGCWLEACELYGTENLI